MCVMTPGLRFSARAAGSLDPRVISSAPLNSFMIEMFFYICYVIYHLLHDFKSKIHFLF